MAEVREKIRIERTSEEVWEVLSDLGNAESWVPFVARSWMTTDGSTGVGSRRVLRHRLGFAVEEEVTEWEVGSGISYEVYGVPYPLTDFRESWTIAPNGTGATVTTRVVYRVRLGSLGGLVDRLVARRLVHRAVRVGHQALKRCVEAESSAGSG